MADAWKIREWVMKIARKQGKPSTDMGGSKRPPKRESDTRRIMDYIKKGRVSIEELSSDIEALISRLDRCADGMDNSAHFDMKAVVHRYREKYGIKATTYVQCNEMCGGRMPIEKYLKKYGSNS